DFSEDINQLQSISGSISQSIRPEAFEPAITQPLPQELPNQVISQAADQKTEKIPSDPTPDLFATQNLQQQTKSIVTAPVTTRPTDDETGAAPILSPFAVISMKFLVLSLYLISIYLFSRGVFS
ncbi:MAG: hypothetical protein AB1403_04720, partial [Candidatus Riflebacteria bacterium]